jgi:hypothetical protein
MPDTHKYHRIVCCHCGHTFDVPAYCHNRFCPICNKVRQSRIRRKLKLLISSIPRIPDYSFKFLTLTIPSQSNSKLQAKNLVKWFRSLRQSELWLNACSGGAFVLEITGRPGSWHIHLHCVIQSKFIPYRHLLKRWKQISGATGVYIQKVHNIDIVQYVTKYITKSTLPENLQRTVSNALKGIRLFQTFGSWHSLCNKIPKLRYRCPVCNSDNFRLLSSVTSILHYQPNSSWKETVCFPTNNR